MEFVNLFTQDFFEYFYLSILFNTLYILFLEFLGFIYTIRIIWQTIQLPIGMSQEVCVGYFCNRKIIVKHLILMKRLPQKSSQILFRVLVKPLVTREDFQYSLVKSNMVNCKSIPDRLLTTLRRLSEDFFPEKSSIKSQISDKLRSIGKLTCLSEKTSREVFSGIFENFSNSKLSQYLQRKTSQDVFCRVDFLRSIPS